MAFLPLSSRDDLPLPEDAYDVRGWSVRTRRDDAHVGTVDDMLLDGDAWPRYLAVDEESEGRRVLVPLDRATAEPGRKRVYVRGLTASGFRALPSWAGDVERLGDDYEERLLDDWRRAERDEAASSGAPSSGPPTAKEGRASLARLSDLDDYDVADGSIDVRGWTIVLGDGRKLGTVVELIFDRDALSVAYLDCDVYEDKLELEQIDRHILLPVEHVRLEQKDRHVIVDGLFAPDVAGYPVYGGLPLGDEAGARIREHFGSSRTGTGGDPRSAARSFFGKGSTPPTHRGSRSDGDGITVHEDREGGDTAVVRKGDQEVRIRITGDDILIEKGRPGAEEADRG